MRFLIAILVAFVLAGCGTLMPGPDHSNVQYDGGASGDGGSGGGSE